MDHRIFQKNVELLSIVTPEERAATPGCDSPLPSVDSLRQVMELVRMLVFPSFFDKRTDEGYLRTSHIGLHLERLTTLLQRQVALALLFNQNGCKGAEKRADQMTMDFVDNLPIIKQTLYTDVEAIYASDPSVKTYGEVIYSYPVIQAMLHYRVAHQLYRMNVPVIPRIITEMAHALTGIDIHPGACIGNHFSIDHGTGVVIGETCVIGHHVTLYQGVTLGAKLFKLEKGEQRPALEGQTRHPIIGDHVTIYSNSTILGPITIGHNAVIGGNVWLTHSVPPFAKIVQGKTMDVTFTDGLGI